MSIAVFHPSVAPFVQQVARAVHEAGWLDRFYTSLRYDPLSWKQRASFAAARLVGRDFRAKLKHRSITEVPPDLVTSFPWGELLRLASGPFDRSGRLTDFVWEKTEEAFAKKVGRHLHAGLSAVYGFEHSSLAAFTRARELGLQIFYDMPAPEPRFVHQLLDRELARFPELKTNYHQYTSAFEEQRIAHRRAEWDLADLVVVASEFTKQSFVSAGLDVSKVRVIPYGAPLPIARARLLARVDENGTPLRLVWAGTFGVRKGAHYLVEAWRKGNFGEHAVLDVYGTVSLPEQFLTPALKGVTFHGPVARSELLAAYQRSDALIFPTLCDGFGMVITEAWSQGLPVITTDRAGGSDLLRPNENGLIVPAADSKALREIIEYCVAQPLILRNMRDVALTTAVRWQWTDYRSALVSTLRPHLAPA
jgi:glycosyltransferase involved in cell wall biosynthesis